MNLPNKLTMLRMFMIPLFLFFYIGGRFVPWETYNGLLFMQSMAFVVFVAASLTDLIDGKIARKYNLITDFGKLMDPLADKLLVTAALCCILPDYEAVGIISLILILSREFLVTSIRLIAAGKGEVLAADIWGKIKTVVQMTWICLMLFQPVFYLFVEMLPLSLWVKRNAIWDVYSYITMILFAAMVAITVASGVHYIVKNRKLFADV